LAYPRKRWNKNKKRRPSFSQRERKTKREESKVAIMAVVAEEGTGVG
jgi:hypothetical protein